MKIDLKNDEMVVRLAPLEKLAAVKLTDIHVPRSSIAGVERSLPPLTWKALRLPGTAIPGLITAGSYYTDRGWEFWYVTRGRRAYPVTVSLKGQRYDRLVLGFPTRSEADRIDAWLRPAASSD
jgi:hypothetical protein